MSEIDLQPFCSTEEYRAYIMKPWTRGGFTWATNGHILVRVLARDGVEPNPDAPNPEPLMSCHDGAEFSPLPVVKRWPKEPRAKKCEVCMGNGKDPEFESVPCFECDGSGLGNGPLVSVGIRGETFQTKYIRLIQTLPGAEFAIWPHPAGPTSRVTKPTPFRFSGGLGALMPLLRKGNENHLGDIESLGRA